MLQSVLIPVRLLCLLAGFFAASALMAGSKASEPPEQHGLQASVLADMTNFIVGQKSPVFSMLISRNGHLVYELYTHNLTRNHSHYLMSVTKSFTATLVGIAIDKGLLQGVDQTVGDALPETWFASPEDQVRFRKVSVKNVLAMSALDALVPPHSNTPDADQRNRDFHSVANRGRFALTQSLLANVGEDFQYQDVTPSLAIAMVTAASGQSSLAFAQEYLFGPLGFINAEWMHRDEDGLDLGAYGLRLRPIDMQKFGILYLDRGMFDGKRVLSENWVNQVNVPVIRSSKDLNNPNYGYFFWHPYFDNDPAALMAAGWRGQFIAVIPTKGLVVTMTAHFTDGKEAEYFSRLVKEFILPSVAGGPQKKGAAQALNTALARALVSRPVDLKKIEPRMIPSVKPLEQRLE